ncbi:Adenylyltransferase and sulfurtransferase uba4 [Rhizoctonia solani]|uniref:Adenylyltransferase and sulfurtransferase uba4 n=1 Tax=Rhizoctonia solani TaxID=456999 RepID=A0A0K6GBN9_9AGAM|nr:Adenylyltransferase and sulfurtransferase uba4 [Rhizoctonia solani]
MTETNELESLRTRVKLLEAQIRSLGHEPIGTPADPAADNLADNQDRLKLDEYIRYGRQMILPGFGLPCDEAQLSLRNSSILVLGAGGLGCPALMYLAAAGVGKITIVDHDLVEVSNLHRQVLHGVDTVGRPKVESARQAILRINPSVHIVTHHISLTSATLPIVFAPNVHFHAVLDCTDTPSTRYLLSDVTARLGIPLISGGAQRTDGQLIIYNLPPTSPASTDSNNANTNGPADQVTSATDPVNSAGPCMRCIFPSISRTGAGAERCSDVGVLGPVVGVIGVLMALETIKILTGFGADESQLYKPSMLLFTGLSPRPFRNIKLRLRQPNCPGCSMCTLHNYPQNLLVSQFIDDSTSLQDNYDQFCDIGGSRTHDDPVLTGAREGESGARVRASVLKEALVSAAANPSLSIRIIDTRPPTEFGICSIPGSVNVPLPLLLKTPESYVSVSIPTFVVCRLGNDSQVAARALRSIIQAKEGDSQAYLDEEPGSILPVNPRQVVDIIGGLRAWAQEVDQSFPIY